MRQSQIYLFARALIWQLAVWLLCLLVLFGAAGTLSWIAGWVFFTTFFGFVLLLSTYLQRKQAGLLAERLVIIRHDQPVWDQIWILSFYLLSLSWLALMPLDAVRWHWSRMPLWVAYIGTLLLLCSLAGIFMTLKENAYASPLVRLQFERGHTVTSTGPYAHLRHPLYSSACVFYIGTPMLLGSWWGLGFAPVFIGLMIYRAVQEERLLCNELPGYKSYMQLVRRRFIPGIW